MHGADDPLGSDEERAFRERCEPFFRAHLDAGDLRAWLAEDGSSPLGMAVVYVRAMMPRPRSTQTHEARVQSVYVVPSARGDGLGRTLVATALGWIRERGIERVVLHPSARARSLYASLGFAPLDEMILAER